jgi:hypothetical protein
VKIDQADSDAPLTVECSRQRLFPFNFLISEKKERVVDSASRCFPARFVTSRQRWRCLVPLERLNMEWVGQEQSSSGLNPIQIDK